MNEKRQRCHEIKEEIEFIKQNIDEISRDIDKKQSELCVLKEMLFQYYHNVLENGKEFRNEGLSWVVRAIWNLGSDVKISKMPSYLDKDSIYYLINVKKYINNI